VAAAAVATVLALGGCGLFDDEATLPTPESDVAYGPVTGCDGSDAECGGSQELDIYRSDAPGDRPVLLFFHGGGFVEGDKAEAVPPELEAALDDGWDVVSVNYRLSTPDANAFPVALQDARRAVRWVKANAQEQGWDPDHVAAMGHSAGGNLVGMLATTSDESRFDPPDLEPELAEHDPSIVAAVALNPVFDIARFASVEIWAGTVAQYAACSRNCGLVHADASVQTHVDSEAAPMLALFGDLDPWAPPEHGEVVAAAYDDAGIGDRYESIVVTDGDERFRMHEVDFPRFIDRFVEFLDRYRD
jgi:acetyl esterase/lipase